MKMRPDKQHISVLAMTALLLTLPILVGCSNNYTIRGRVVRGPYPAVQLVSANDPRLKETNSTGSAAEVIAVLEPNTPTERQDLGRYITDPQGWFTIPVNAFGSGFLEYEAQFIATRQGNQGAIDTIPLPGSGQRVLITLPLGANNVKRPERFLDSVIRDAEPYLDKD